MDPMISIGTIILYLIMWVSVRPYVLVHHIVLRLLLFRIVILVPYSLFCAVIISQSIYQSLQYCQVIYSKRARDVHWQHEVHSLYLQL